MINRGGFDRVIEAVGSRAALSRCLQLVGGDGRINLYGVAPESEPYLPEEVADPRALRFQVAEAEVHDRLLDWVEQGKVDLADWVSHEMVWTDYGRGFEMVKHFAPLLLGRAGGRPTSRDPPLERLTQIALRFIFLAGR